MSHDAVKNACEHFSKFGPLGTQPTTYASGQRPTTFGVPGLTANPWWDIPSLSNIFESQDRNSLLDEFRILSAKKSPTEQMPSIEGKWNRFGLMEEGEWLEANCLLCPLTVAFLKLLPLCQCALGHAYFSVINGKTQIPEHCGPTNVKLRVQLCLVPGTGGCTITVGGVTTAYQTGSTMIFDDSFPHSVHNKDDSERVVLLFDIWHPDLTSGSVALLTETLSKEAILKTKKPVLVHKSDGINRFPLLPLAPLQKILCLYLLPTDLCRLAQTCKLLNGVSNNGDLWKALCQRDRGNLTLPSSPPPVIAAPPPSTSSSWFRRPAASANDEKVGSWKTLYRDEIYCPFTPVPTQVGAPYDAIAKLLMVGQNGVGKSCFLLRFAEDSFTTNYISTIGVDFKIKTVKSSAGIWKVQIWDTAGPERFRTITSAYYRGAHGIFVMYNVNDRDAFNNIGHWFREIERHGQESCQKILVATQCDHPDRVVSSEEGRAAALEFQVPYCECSAKTGQGVAQAVYTLLRATTPNPFVPKTPPNKAKVESKTKKTCALQ